MGTVTILVSDGTNVLRLEPMGSAELEEIVDADLAQFNECFQRELGNDPLIKSELAVLKTYLWYKCRRDVCCAPAQGELPSDSSA